MKHMITIIACVVAVLYLPVSLGMPYYPMDMYGPSYYGGDSYFDEDHVLNGGSRGGDGYRRQGSNVFYDEGENHHRTKQVYENENHSRHNTGGRRQGSSSGGSFGSNNVFRRDRLNGGRGFDNFGPSIYY